VAAPPVAFYCVADARYFLGVVAMVNSLRLVGHTEPVYVLDCGMSDLQREVLAHEAEIVAAPREAPPWLLKTIAPLREPAAVRVLIDADVIVTRPLGEPIADVSTGKVAAFRAGYERFFPEWGEILGLGPVRRQPYLCSAIVFLGGDPGEVTLRALDASQERIPAFRAESQGKRRQYFKAAASDPFATLDQDAFNAVLGARVEPRDVVALEHRLAPEPPFAELRLADERALRCSYGDAVEPYVLHHLGPKPWLAAVRENLYVRLLVRLLAGPDLALRVPDSAMPLRLRSGRIAGAGRRLAGAQDRLRTSVWEPLSWRVGSRFDALVARLGRPPDRS
jgi:hypothetical protein